jgi:mono/diheme cytochrome c family protein
MRPRILALGALAMAVVATAISVRAAEQPAPAAPPAAVDARPAGQRLYARHCLSCHQADGYGVPNMQPAITDGTWVKGDARALAMFVMTGGFDSQDRKDSANGNVMPPFAQLPDEELAQILTFIRQKFGKGASAVTTADIIQARKNLTRPPN